MMCQRTGRLTGRLAAEVISGDGLRVKREGDRLTVERWLLVVVLVVSTQRASITVTLTTRFVLTLEWLFRGMCQQMAVPEQQQVLK